MLYPCVVFISRSVCIVTWIPHSLRYSKQDLVVVRRSENGPTSTYNRERSMAQRMKKRIYDTYKEAKKARRWDPDRECYLDSKGNICIKIDDAKRAEKERLKEESRQRYLKSLEQKKDEGIIDTTKEMTTENLKKMADQALMAKALEVDSKSASSSESSGKVSSSGSENESGKADSAKTESVCKGCTKECNVCNTHTYLANTRIQELIEKMVLIDKEVLNHDKLVKASRVLQAKEKQINQQLDEIANLKLQFQEAKIENERINLKLNNYNSASFVLQHIVPKQIGKNKAGEDVYWDGTRVGYHQVPPPMLNNFTKKQSGLANESETSEKTNIEKLPETIDVTFTSQSDEDSI
ncbi:hypothetical protein Hanom_Chr01g00049231 [Helianthus anomalus]